MSGLLRRFSKAYKQAGYAFVEDPVETFQNHIWVAPYYEDDLMELRELIGVDHILFGSDYPHAEGLASPMDFLDDLVGFSSHEIKQIMYENGRALVTPST